MARRKGVSLTRNDVIAAALTLVEESGPAALVWLIDSCGAFVNGVS